jgi:N-acylglucosamine-6-phosphate 2-epimerase
VSMHATLERVHGGLVVSCQAREGEPLRDTHVITAIARAVVDRGARGLRIESLPDIASVRSAVDAVVIGLVKVAGHDVYITPRIVDAVAVARAGAHIVAVDGTARPRPDGASLDDVVAAVHAQGAAVLCDVSTLDEGLAAAAAGADAVATTLSGYTPYSPQRPEPDLDLVSALSSAVAVPVLAEGRIRTPKQAAAALERGAWAVVVGGAITRPGDLAGQFAARLEESAGRAGYARRLDAGADL